MHRSIVLGLAVLMMAATLEASAAAALPPAVATAAARIAAHDKFLSADLLEGRGTGTRGGDIAAAYIATQFALDGLKPMGDGGSYMQKVRFEGITSVPEQAQFSLVGDSDAFTTLPLRYAEDFVAMNPAALEADDIDAPVVFVGFGIDAPEYDWHDFKTMDVGGKILLLFVNEPISDDPKFFNGAALTYFGRWMYKFEEAARRGARGVLIIHRNDLASYPWAVVRDSNVERVQIADDLAPKLHLASWIQLDIANKMFASIGKTADEMYQAANSKSFQPIALPLRLKGHLVSTVRHFESSNVLAMLPGRDATDARNVPTQVVVYSAHYDHLGMLPGNSGDRIYNGAVDDGIGCSVLLELARVYAGARIKPPHSILFAATTAEEKGLIGSDYLSRHLPIPAAGIALDLNFDVGLLPIGTPTSIVATGAERTTLYPTLTKMAADAGLSIEPDSNPGAGYYFRADHFSFARVGIPAFSIGQGATFAGHPKAWGEAQQKDYVQHRYHQPADKFDPNWDFTGIAKIAGFAMQLGWAASAAPTSVAWQAGDPLAAARRASQAKPGS